MNLQGRATERAAVRRYTDGAQSEPLTPYFPVLPPHAAVLPQRAHSLEEFTEELKAALDKQQLPKRALDFVFQGDHMLSQPHPNCEGTQSTSMHT